MQETLKNELIKHRRYLHQNPELGLELPNTFSYVKNVLESYGYKPERCGENGIVATVGQGSKVVLLRADMDALPLNEQTDFAHKSKIKNCMHACGHDMHTTMLLGAAKMLKETENNLNGVVKLMFQPGEEILKGANNMIKAGILENPKPEAAFMVHVSTGIPLETGTLIVSAPGTVAPSSDHFTITINGKGCHGSMPQSGTDPIIAASQFLISVQALQTREFAHKKILLTFGIFHAGESANAIPDAAVLSGTLRTFDEETRTQCKERMENLLKNCVRSFECDANIRYTAECPPVICDKNLSEFAMKNLTNTISSDSIPKGTGSEDFAFISQKIPSVLVYIPAGDSRNGYTYPLHNPRAMFDENALMVGAYAYRDFAVKYLNK
ncbi:MAG: amidohydrolase [Clostridia bacterium]|nr:amidohydrolase [Clostridia bacterium]